MIAVMKVFWRLVYSFCSAIFPRAFTASRLTIIINIARRPGKI